MLSRWVWPVLLIPTIFFAPESPWWLVRSGRREEAKATQQRLLSPDNDTIDISKQVAFMVFTTKHERKVNSQVTYWACFKGTDLKRTMVVIGIYSVQAFSGNSLRSSSTYFLEQAGLRTTELFNITLVSYALAVVGGLVSVSDS
jgi:MFS transporter, SP family, general alpha glucoside:H+ symporter